MAQLYIQKSRCHKQRTLTFLYLLYLSHSLKRKTGIYCLIEILPKIKRIFEIKVFFKQLAILPDHPTVYDGATTIDMPKSARSISAVPNARVIMAQSQILWDDGFLT